MTGPDTPAAGPDTSGPGPRSPAVTLALAAYRPLDRLIGRALAFWRRPGVTATISLALFLVGLWLIGRALSDYSMPQLQAAAIQIGWANLGLAILGVIVSYGALTLNDRFALDAMDRRLPHARTARASLAAYALARNLGYSWATAGTARLRLYRKWGLAPGEIGALSLVTGVGVQVGALTAAGIGLALAAPEIARHGPFNALFWWAVAAVLLAPAAVWLGVAGRGPGSVRINDVAVRTPAPGAALRQLIVLTADRVGAAFVLFALLPDHGGWTFPGFLAVFVLAGLLGALSGAPGGLGVFEAVILTLAPVTQDTPGAAAALLVYRVLYNLIPLACATLILGGDHAAPAARPAARAAQRLGEAAYEFSPRILAVMVFVTGLVLLSSVATPAFADRLKALRGLDLSLLSGMSHFLASLVGVMLLIVASGLWRKVDSAWAAAVALLVAGIVFSIAKALDWEEALILAIALACVLPCRGAFTARSGWQLGRLSPGWLAAAVGAVTAAGWLAWFVHLDGPAADDALWSFWRNTDAARSVRALAGASALTLVFAAWSLLQPWRARGDAPSCAQETGRAEAAFAAATGARADANLAFLGDKRFVFSDTGRSFAMFRPRGDRWLFYGDPVGPREERAELLALVRERAEAEDCRPAWYSVSRDMMGDLAEIGHVVRKIGETAILDLPVFSLDGHARRHIRGARNRLATSGARFEVVPAEGTAALIEDLRPVSDAWLAQHKGREKGFSLGDFNPAYLSRFPTALFRDAAGAPLAFANLWTTPDRRELAIDLMRYRPDAPNGVMEAVIAETALWARGEGYARMDLGMAPLAGLEDRRGAPLMSRLGAILFEEGEDFYGFRGLRAFKDKFGPAWEPLYLCAPPDVLLPAALLDVAVLTSKGRKAAA